jgi:hypothetical protein
VAGGVEASMTSPPDSRVSGVRRRLVPPLVAVTVLAVLLGGGSLLRARSHDAASGSGAPTVLRLADYQRPSAVTPADDLFRLSGKLPDGPADAAVRRLTAPDGSDVERLAKALGLRGALTRAGGASTYATSSASLRVQDGPGGQWQYVSGVASDGAVACPGPTPARPKIDDQGLTLSCNVTEPVAPDATSTHPSGVPSAGASSSLAVTTAAAARAAARPVLEAAGIDPDSATARAGQGFVVADPTVDALPTHGLTTTVRVTGTRVSSAGGYLGAPQAGATYPVISARAAWQQLQRLPLARPLIACAEPQPDDSDPMTCGGPITVTGARFGLSLHQENGQPLLVPSWLFDVRGSGNALAIVAVDPRYLASPPAATASDLTPGSSGSGSSGSGSSGSGSSGSGVPPVAPSPDAPPPDAVTMEPAPPDTRFSSVTTSGRGLAVEFTGGVSACFTYIVVPTETDRRVSLALVEHTSSNARCIEMAQVYEREVRLAEPLGTRQVVDARSGAVLLPARR